MAYGHRTVLITKFTTWTSGNASKLHVPLNTVIGTLSTPTAVLAASFCRALFTAAVSTLWILKLASDWSSDVGVVWELGFSLNLFTFSMYSSCLPLWRPLCLFYSLWAEDCPCRFYLDCVGRSPSLRVLALCCEAVYSALCLHILLYLTFSLLPECLVSA